MVLLVVSLIIVFPLALSDDTGSKKIQIVRLLTWRRKNNDFYIFASFLTNLDNSRVIWSQNPVYITREKTDPLHILG